MTTVQQVHYPATNEGLLGIIEGLKPTKNDNILSICGSGDQAFALLEYARTVLAVDISLPQLAYTRKRMEYLKERKFDDFLYPPGHKSVFADKKEKHDLIARAQYFTPERLERIAQNLDRLTLTAKCIYDHVIENEEQFTKIYLSNALEHIVRSIPESLHLEYQADVLNQFAEALKYEGNLFISGRENGVQAFLEQNPQATPKLRIDQNRTIAARKTIPFHRGIQFVPTIFRKAA